MAVRLLFIPLLAISGMLAVTTQLCAAPRRPYATAQTSIDVDATVLSIKRLQYSTYVEVQRDDGLHEWVDIQQDTGMSVKAGMRVSYEGAAHQFETKSFGQVRRGDAFRVITARQSDQVYRGVNADGVVVYTDNPTENEQIKGKVATVPVSAGKAYKNRAAKRRPRSAEPVFKETGADGTPSYRDNPTEQAMKKSTAKKGTSKNNTTADNTPVEEVTAEERQRRDAVKEEFYRYSEQVSSENSARAERAVRKAKRAKQRSDN